jgi:outer membrane receptor protein involved in Fe transport
MDRANVGGSQSGQQSGFVVRGANTTNNVWSLDGVNVTDMSATGATTMYYNFDAFEEMQYNIGGNDVTIATGGMGINLVTKSGSDKLRGSTRYLITDNKFQDDNVTDELRAQGASAGNPIQRNQEYGVETGGPIMKGRLWFWGAVARTDVKVGVNGFFKKDQGCPTSSTQARQLSTEALRACLQTDQTLLKNYTFKFTGRTFGGNRAEWFSDYADKFRNARDASSLRPPETVTVQSGPVWTHKAHDTHVISDRWLAEAQYAFVGGGFALDFPNPSEQFSVQRYFDEVTGEYRRAFSQSIFDRPLYLIDTKTTYFLPHFMGGDHAFKLGYSFRHAPVSSYSHIGGFVEARFRNGVPTTASMYRDSSTEYLQTTNSFFAQDEYQAGRFTLRAGVRYDRYVDIAKASSVNANPIIPNLLPAVDFAGVDPGLTWNNFSPRFGLNYDVFGSGKTVAGVTYSRYFGQPGANTMSERLNPVTEVYLRYPWNDLNSDQLVTANELDLTATPTISGNYNPAAPGSPTTINRVDPNLKNERTDEIILGLQHELLPGVALSANYIYRKYNDFRWTVSDGITSDVYQPTTTTPSSCYSAANTPAPCPSITYYVPTVAIGGRAQILQNRPDYSRGYNGFELAVTKRYSKRWYANASYAYNSAVDHYDSLRGVTSNNPVTDPTNFDKLNGHQWAAESSGSGVSNVWVNAKWVARATGSYTLPWDVQVSGFLNGHQGYILPYGYTTAARPNGAAAITVVFDPYGESRLPSFWQFDFKVERAVQVNRIRFRPQATIFNLTNSNVVLGRQRNMGSTSFNDVLQILGPRVIQFGVRVDF